MADTNDPPRPIKLSLERPYTNDEGEPLFAVADILPNGDYVYEPSVVGE
jgi:mediator of RNA polymerase II transcription subunit 17